MIFYTVTMDITKLSAFLTQIRQDLRRTGGPFQGTVCLFEGI